MDSLVGYGSDDENENERFDNHLGAVSVSAGSARRRDDDTNYDDVNMDMSEDSQAESEPELPPAEPAPRHADAGRDSSDSREREGDRRDRRGRESPRRDKQRDRRDDRHRSDRERERGRDGRDSRRGLLGDRPEERQAEAKVPALMDLKLAASPGPRDTASPRRDRGDRDRDRERRDRPRDRDRDNRGHGRRQEEKPGRNRTRSRSRSRPRGAAFPPPAAHAAHTTHATHAGHAAHASSSGEKRISPPSGDYRPSSYKVNKKLEVMEKMGLQIKTPDGSMATAQQLRAAAGEPAGAPGGPLPPYYNPAQGSAARILDQVAKRKLLWSHKAKAQAAEAGAGAGAAAGAGAGAWKGTRFAQDSDGRQASKFMRLMGIKEPAAALKPDATNANGDPIKKQEELFQAMQAQYEVARATTHTMRGVGLGFQRGQF